MYLVNENIQSRRTYEAPHYDALGRFGVDVQDKPLTSEQPRLAPHVAEWDTSLSSFQRSVAENAMRQAGVEVSEG